MTLIARLAATAAALAVLAPVGATAHAHLAHAVPAANAKVSGSPSELELAFTEDVVPAVSTVRITGASGAAVAAEKPTPDAAKKSLLHVRLDKALPPGIYTVRWHVVATDTHATSGTYTFTVGQ